MVKIGKTTARWTFLQELHSEIGLYLAQWAEFTWGYGDCVTSWKKWATTVVTVCSFVGILTNLTQISTFFRYLAKETEKHRVMEQMWVNNYFNGLPV